MDRRFKIRGREEKLRSQVFLGGAGRGAVLRYK